MKEKVSACIAGGAGGIMAYLFGPWDGLICALVALVALDYITGVAGAAAAKELSSSLGFKGLVKKALIFSAVAVAGIADRVLPAANHAIRAAVILFYCANEALSILENGAKLGLPIPKGLKAALIKAKDDETPPK